MLVTFVALFATLTASLLFVGVFAQGALYETVARRMPLRAAVGGLILAAFLTGWTYLNTRASSKDRFGTLFEFNSTSVAGYDSFDALRVPGPVKAGQTFPEKRTAYKRAATGKSFEANEPTKAFVLSTVDEMTVALEVPDGDEKARFDAELGPDGNFKDKSNKVFRDKKGRFIECGKEGPPGAIQTPSKGAFFGAVLLNLGCVVVWFAVLWPVMQFSSGHAIGGAVILGGITILLLMPLLFDKNAVAAPAAARKAV